MDLKKVAAQLEQNFTSADHVQFHSQAILNLLKAEFPEETELLDQVWFHLLHIQESSDNLL